MRVYMVAGLYLRHACYDLGVQVDSVRVGSIVAYDDIKVVVPVGIDEEPCVGAIRVGGQGSGGG